MSEMEAVEYCPKCKQDQIFLFSGSGTKGVCEECNYELPPEQHANFNRVISYTG